MKTKIIRLDNPTIINALKANEGYCPCRVLKTKDTKCMCKEFREQEIGICHCSLYEKVKIEK